MRLLIHALIPKLVYLISGSKRGPGVHFTKITQINFNPNMNKYDQ